MANEITHQTKLNWSRSNASITAVVDTLEDQDADMIAMDVRFVGAESRRLVLGDIADVKYVMFKNLEPKGKEFPDLVVIISQNDPAQSSDAPITLHPQQGVVVPNPGELWYAVAETQTVRVGIFAIEV